MRPLFALTLIPVLGGCQTPCEQLDRRAAGCELAPSTYADRHHAVCAATAAEVGAEPFAAFASCVLDAPCDDHGVIDRCQAQAGLEPGSPCRRYQLWAAGCGLEPRGTADACQTLTESMGELVFGNWVACVTDQGCPVERDPRYDRCQQELVPVGAISIFDACTVLGAWSAACSAMSPDVATVGGGDVASCITASQPFTAASFYDYAQCLAPIACDDLAGRIDCLFRLQPTDPTGTQAPCERILAYSGICGLDLGGGSVEACVRLFARFTGDSASAYATCLEGKPCDDPTASVECATLLRLQ
ncbi:MAG: hypothetical protein HY903_17085 [Deltaproteobacteria bacterium]|nr:hypothetical protein [Deltaproteobacteria bacterium]